MPALPAARRLFAATLALAVVAAAGACSTGESRAAAPGKPLRIGYQRFGGLSLAKARQAYPGATWSLFDSGPALTEALKAGAIDLGQTGEAPPIFAAAGKTGFSIIATS
ncbi:MAG: sulfonate transport system substrate-binding protein, partial [Cryptosporangiaceae bacterium]|nr:sulfonate transport system substrate-binding protein [Cryptosporangiaceae bacterium]